MARHPAMASRQPATRSNTGRAEGTGATDMREAAGSSSRDDNHVVVEMPANPSCLLTTEQAAEILAVSVRTVKNLMSDGKLAYVKIGRATRVDLEDINQYVTRNRRKQRQGLRRVN
jgi:excisionase family DNA binding protein